MKGLHEVTLRELIEAVALVEMAKEAGISVDAAQDKISWKDEVEGLIQDLIAPSGKSREKEIADVQQAFGLADSVAVNSVLISKANLSGMVWGERELSVYYKTEDGLDGSEWTRDPEVQERLFALAGYRPLNPWKDGE